MLQGILRDPLAILSDRSPGERSGAALVQSKPHMQVGPTERVLSPVLDRPAPYIPADLDNLPERAMEVVNPGQALAPGAPPVGGNPPLPIPGVPGGAIIPPPPGGGGGGGGGNPPPPPGPPPPPPVVTPVPEPATWIMMIVGVGMIGWQLRRRRSAGLVAAV